LAIGPHPTIILGIIPQHRIVSQTVEMMALNTNLKNTLLWLGL
jgi:hypothetical protein